VKRFALPLMMTALLMPGAAKAEISPEQKTEIEALMQEYILNNGQLLIESVNKFQMEQEAEANKAADAKAKDLIAAIQADKNLAETGNPKGDVMVVEFFDYNCGYCKKALEEIQQLRQDDKNVRIVFYDMPILGPESVEAARWSLAAKKQGKYFDYHALLMNHAGTKDEAVYKKLAEQVGMDAKKLAADKASPEIEEKIKNNIAMAQGLGVQGTPGFLVNERIFRGYIPYDVLKNTVNEAREAAKSE